MKRPRMISVDDSGIQKLGGWIEFEDFKCSTRKPSTVDAAQYYSHWCILQVNAVQDVYLQIVYLFDIIDEHCIYFVLMMTFGIIFE